MNWSGVSFTPSGGQTLAITGVTEIEIENKGNLVKFSGDGDRYYTTVVNDVMDPTITIHTADLMVLRTIATGTLGTFVATLNDARNGTGTGSITFSLTNAVVASTHVHGTHRQFGQGKLVISSFSTDGVTNPLSTSIGI